MKSFNLIIVTTMFFGFFGCKAQNKDFVFDEFKSQIEQEGMKIDSVDETGLVYISQGEFTLKVSLDNVRKNYQRDNDPSHISDLVRILTSYSTEIPSEWVDAKNDIFLSLFPNDDVSKDFLYEKITDEFGKVYVHSGQDKFSWITHDDLKKWNVTQSELDRQANLNADKLLASTEITFDTIEDHKLGMINAEHETLKGALLFAPAMREKARKDFGFPFFAVIPVRDFCYIFSQSDYEFFSKRIGLVVVDEYKKSGYPVTTEILKFADNGVEAVGSFPVQ